MRHPTSPMAKRGRHRHFSTDASHYKQNRHRKLSEHEKISDTLNIGDLRRMAAKRLPSFLLDYVERGNGLGAARNVSGFEKYPIISRNLRKVVPPDTSQTKFGHRYDLPFGISVVGAMGVLRAVAEEHLGEIAREFNIPFMLSSMSTKSIETIARIEPSGRTPPCPAV